MAAIVGDVLADLHGRGIELRADGNLLRFRPKAAVDDRLRAVLAEHKAEILAALAGGGRTGDGMAPSARVADSTNVPAGWTVASWRDRLRYLAGVCMNPARAAELREWADALDSYAADENLKKPLV